MVIFISIHKVLAQLFSRCFVCVCVCALFFSPSSFSAFQIHSEGYNNGFVTVPMILNWCNNLHLLTLQCNSSYRSGFTKVLWCLCIFLLVTVCIALHFASFFFFFFFISDLKRRCTKVAYFVFNKRGEQSKTTRKRLWRDSVTTVLHMVGEKEKEKEWWMETSEEKARAREERRMCVEPSETEKREKMGGWRNVDSCNHIAHVSMWGISLWQDRQTKYAIFSCSLSLSPLFFHSCSSCFAIQYELWFGSSFANTIAGMDSHI